MSSHYIEENRLRDLPADDKLAGRKKYVAPKVDALFAYVHELFDSGIIFSEKLAKAIAYAINQEECLRRYLTDGNIPCDNGASERHIRSYSVGRVNWLFADTKTGAEVIALMYTAVDTAKANHANVYIYMKYLLENVPKHLDAQDQLTDRDFLPDMMPWSEAYRAYERQSLEDRTRIFRELGSSEPEAPKAPRKSDISPPVDFNRNTA